MPARWRLGTPARLSLLFVLVAGTLLATLAWFWRATLLEERREADRQQLERLDNAAALLSQDFERRLDGWHTLAATALAKAGVAPPPGTVLLVFDATGVLRHAGLPLPYLPRSPPAPEPDDPTLAAAIVQEFHLKQLSSAAVLYRRASAARDHSTQAAALVGLARVLRLQNRPHDALAAYQALAELGATSVAGFPASLIAHRERSALFRELGDQGASDEELGQLRTALANGSGLIDRATFDEFATSFPREPPVASSTVLADAAIALWPRWQQEARGRGAARIQEEVVVAVWQSSGADSAAVLGRLATLMVPAIEAIQALGVDVMLRNGSGEVIWGDIGSAGGTADRSLTELGLPWTLTVASNNPGSARTRWAARRNLLSAGFVLMALVIAAASYTVFRSINRELGVARLQSDFVAAVSHEFRSPLTAMRHLTEVLEEGTASRGQLGRYYRALGEETRRLQRLVEHLLDFGRIQAGRRDYLLQADDAVEIVRAVVEDCRPLATTTGHELTLTATAGPLPVCADRAALSLALRNLVDNAIKYSPAGSRVAIAVERRDPRIAIGVTDHGDGVPAAEQRRIFRQFVRGSSATGRHIKGTGIGLTMADRIVRGHGGRLELRSQPGVGSTFTILLPILEEAAPEGSRDQ